MLVYKSYIKPEGFESDMFEKMRKKTSNEIFQFIIFLPSCLFTKATPNYTSTGPLSFRLALIGLGSTGLGSFGLGNCLD